MVAKPIDMMNIYKRGRLLERRKNLLEEAYLSYEDDEASLKTTLESYLNECASYKPVVEVLEKLYENNNFSLLENVTSKLAESTIPMLTSEELNECISVVEAANIGDVNKTRLIEAAKTFKTVERIRDNHNKLSKRFGLDEAYINKSDKAKCDSICEMVDTYNTAPYIKMNIALEELVYSRYITGTDTPDEVIVENVTNYFLLRKENKKSDIANYRKVLKESSILKDGADANVKFLTEKKSESFIPRVKTWRDSLNEWKLDPHKELSTLNELAAENYSNMPALREIVTTIKEFVKINNIEDYEIKSILEAANSGINKGDARNLLDLIKENNIQDVDDMVSSLCIAWEADINDDVYAGKQPAEPVTFTSDKIDHFKLTNLINDAKSADEFINTMEKNAMKQCSCEIFKEDIPNEFECICKGNLADFVDESGYINLKLASYKYNGNTEEINSLLESVNNCLNNMLYNSDSRAYYVLGEDAFDICLRTKYQVILSEAEKLDRDFTPCEKSSILTINDLRKAAAEYNASLFAEICSKMEDRNFAASLEPEKFSVLAEALAPYCGIGEDSPIYKLVELCREEVNPKYFTIKSNYDALKEAGVYEADPTIDHNAILEFCAYVVLGLPAPEQYKPVTEGAVGGFANGIRSMWNGIKSKISGGSPKDQELARDLDSTFNNLCRSLDSTYTDNRRMQVIQGQVTPSLSKLLQQCIKTIGASAAVSGVAKLALGTFINPLYIAAVSAAINFVKGTAATPQEKKKLLDEIDTELSIVGRELQRAEQNGSTAEYKQYLTMQKNLQRKRQELYFSFAKKGQRIPIQSTVGQNTNGGNV